MAPDLPVFAAKAAPTVIAQTFRFSTKRLASKAPHNPRITRIKKPAEAGFFLQASA